MGTFHLQFLRFHGVKQSNIPHQGEEANERGRQTEGQRGTDVLSLHRVLRVKFVVDLNSFFRNYL